MNLFFWLGTKVLPYVQFTYFNMLSEDPSGSFTKICDVTLPRLLRVRRPWYLKKDCTCVICHITFQYFQTDWSGKVYVIIDLEQCDVHPIIRIRIELYLRYHVLVLLYNLYNQNIILSRTYSSITSFYDYRSK